MPEMATHIADAMCAQPHRHAPQRGGQLAGDEEKHRERAARNSSLIASLLAVSH
jgi:hypothetical protein